MAKKHTHKTKDVQKIELVKLQAALAAWPADQPVDPKKLLLALVGFTVVVALDVAKTKFVGAIGLAQGMVVELFRFMHPTQTRLVLDLVEGLIAAKIRVQVVLEPTGSYGDAIRYQCHRLGAEIYMVRPKYTHDMAEIMDGVPSTHDPKAALTLFELHRMNKSSEWKPPLDKDRKLRALVDERRFYMKVLRPAYGQMEAILAKCWPGIEEVMDLYGSKTPRELIMNYGSPEDIVANQDEARKLMRTKSRGRFTVDKIEKIIAAANSSLGQPLVEEEKSLLKHIVEQIHETKQKIDAIDAQIDPRVKEDKVLNWMASLVGVGTAATLVAMSGSPVQYPSARAYEKALGLNLKERSSGEKKGQLSITKRGNGDARQVLYLASLRWIQSSEATRKWYQSREAYQAKVKKKAVVAVMRKLARALWHVARGARYNEGLLFDLKRLGLQVETVETTVA
jgi:transposase